MHIGIVVLLWFIKSTSDINHHMFNRYVSRPILVIMKVWG